MRRVSTVSGRDTSPRAHSTPAAAVAHRSGHAVTLSPLIAVAAASHRAGDLRSSSGGAPSTDGGASLYTDTVGRATAGFMAAAESAMAASHHNLAATASNIAGLGIGAQRLLHKRYVALAHLQTAHSWCTTLSRTPHVFSPRPITCHRYDPRDEAEASRQAKAAEEAAEVVRQARDRVEARERWRRAELEYVQSRARAARAAGDEEALADAEQRIRQISSRAVTTRGVVQRWKFKSRRQLEAEAEQSRKEEAAQTWKDTKFFFDVGRNAYSKDKDQVSREEAAKQLENIGRLPTSELTKMVKAVKDTGGSTNSTARDVEGRTVGRSFGTSIKGAKAATRYAGTIAEFDGSVCGSHASVGNDQGDTGGDQGVAAAAGAQFAVSPREAALEAPIRRGNEPLLALDDMPKLKAAVRTVVINRLTTVDLAGAHIGDAGAIELCVALSNNSALTVLSLRDNGLTVRAAQALRRVLEQNSTLTALDVSSNPLDDVGVLEMAGVVRQNRGLRQLFLADTEMGEAAVLGLARGVVMHNSTLLELQLHPGPHALMVRELAEGSPRPAVKDYQPWEWKPISGRGADPEFEVQHRPLGVLEVMFLTHCLSFNAHNLMTLEYVRGAWLDSVAAVAVVC